MKLINIIKSAFIKEEEIKNIKKTFPEFFDFCNEYGYVPLTCSEVAIEDRFLTVRKVIRFRLVFRKNADLVAICREFRDITGQEIFMPSEISEYQYITIYGWRRYDDACLYYRDSDIVFVFGEECRLPYFNESEGNMHINGGTRESIFHQISKELIENYYHKFIKEVTESLILQIKHYNAIGVFRYYDGGWYIKYMKDKYKDKIPSLHFEESEEKDLQRLHKNFL